MNKSEAEAKPRSKWGRLRSLFKNKKVKISNFEEHIFDLSKLLTKQPHSSTQKILYKFPELPNTEIQISTPNQELSLKEVADARNDKIDSTGFLLWPSEEIVSSFLLREIFPKEKFENFETKGNFRILELGAGYSGLAGIALHKQLSLMSVEHEIVITDGNADCAGKIEKNLEMNNLKGKIEFIKSEAFNWKDYEQFGDLQGKFDLIFGADVLFFRDYHFDLISSLDVLLNKENPEARVVLMAPDRDKTLSQFLAKLDEKAGETDFEYCVTDLGEFGSFGDLMNAARENSSFMKDKHNLKIVELTVPKNNKNPLINK
jgi:predicted nicotinamide N-methyase